MNKGLISSIFDWFKHPLNSDENIMDWMGFLVIALMVSFVWATVVNQIE